MMDVRRAFGRKLAAAVDTQSVQTKESGGPSSSWRHVQITCIPLWRAAMNRSGLAVHLNAFASFPLLLDELPDRLFELLDGFVDAAPAPSAGRLPEEALDRFHPGAGGRRAVEGPAPTLRQPLKDGSVLADGVVLHVNRRSKLVPFRESAVRDLQHSRQVCASECWRRNPLAMP